jgi:hypothetical protein
MVESGGLGITLIGAFGIGFPGALIVMAFEKGGGGTLFIFFYK